MRLSDIRRPRHDEKPLPPRVEADLEAIDAAILGEELPAEAEGLDTLVADIRGERPEADPGFNAALDSWAAAGFPRGGRPGASEADAGGHGSRLPSFGPRRWLPIAATATALVVVAGVSISQRGEQRGGEEGTVIQSGAPGQDASDAPGTNSRSAEQAAPGAAALDAGGHAGTNRALLEASRNDLAKNVRGRDRRLVDRDAELTLSAPAADVPDVTNRAIDVVEAADGVVLSSRVTGTGDSAQATLALQVPTAQLDAVVTGLSDLADVRSRSERSVDITQSVVTARDRLVGLRAERENLAGRIRDADTDAEVEALKDQLASVNRQIASARDELGRGRARARISTVDLQITSEGAGEGGWSLGDALGDAGRVLEVGAGIALISAAVLVPLALIGAVAYGVVAASGRRARERALDDE